MTKGAIPAIFLDRDGVLTKEKSYVTKISELEIFSYTRYCIEKIKKKGYLAIVITNQSAVAKGLMTEKELIEINNYLQQETGVDAIYYCPHHPGAEKIIYRKRCNCRKPKIGLFQKAEQDFIIDMGRSCMIGDRASDILAGKNMGLKTILLESGYGSKRLEYDVRADYLFENLWEVCESDIF